MDPDHATYVYGSYHDSFPEGFLDQQPSYLPQPDFVDAVTQSAGHYPPGHWDGRDFYQTISGGSSATVNQVFLSSDGSDASETLSETSFYLPPTSPIAYPSTPIDFLDLITPQAIRPSWTIFTSNGVQHYRCVCGHKTRRKGDMRRHHESSKHSHRKHRCYLCNRLFTRQDGLTRHMRKMH